MSEGFRVSGCPRDQVSPPWPGVGKQWCPTPFLTCPLREFRKLVKSSLPFWVGRSYFNRIAFHFKKNQSLIKNQSPASDPHSPHRGEGGLVTLATCQERPAKTKNLVKNPKKRFWQLRRRFSILGHFWHPQGLEPKTRQSLQETYQSPPGWGWTCLKQEMVWLEFR